MAHCETINLSALVSNEKIYLIPVDLSDLEMIEGEIGRDLFEAYEFDYVEGNHLYGIPLNGNTLFQLFASFNVSLERFDRAVVRDWMRKDPLSEVTEKFA